MADLPPIIFLDGQFFYGPDPAPDRHGDVNPMYRDLRVRTTEGESSVYEALRALDGQAVRLLAHHHPTPNHRGDLFFFEGEGLLHFTLDHREMTGGWELEDDGNSTTIPLGWTMNGHRGRLVVVPKMTEQGLIDNMADVSGLVDRLQNATAVLRSLRGLAGDDS